MPIKDYLVITTSGNLLVAEESFILQDDAMNLLASGTGDFAVRCYRED
jgi:hypothetical protein